MSISRNLVTAVLMTLVTTLLLGVAYPLVVTGLAQMLFPEQANGQLIRHQGRIIGSRIIGQPFTSAAYFHGRPSAAGADGYDAGASGGSNLGPTSKKLIDAVERRIADAEPENRSVPVPIDLVTASGSGLDPHISPAGALFQVPRVARARRMPDRELVALVESHVEGRQFGLLGEPRVNVLELNLALDERWPIAR
jgi:K+-transporting ATPase ATPase C chain